MLAENTRFLLGDENDVALAKKMVICRLCCDEPLRALSTTCFNCLFSIYKRACRPAHIRRGISNLKAKKPRVAYIGGKKISTKLPLLVKLLQSVNVICFGGGIANTLLHVRGYSLGTSWVEYSFLKEVDRFYALAERYGVQLVLPVDVATTVDLNTFEHKRNVMRLSIFPQECIVDIGPKTIERVRALASAQTSTG